MTTTVLQATGRESIPRAWLRYAAMSSGLLVVVATALFLVWPWLYEQAVVKILLPRHEAEFGFHGGWIRPANFEYSAYGVASLVPGGRLERAGVKAGDIPVYGAVSLYEALEDVKNGRVGLFSVVSDEGDWLNDRRRTREIRVYWK